MQVGIGCNGNRDDVGGGVGGPLQWGYVPAKTFKSVTSFCPTNLLGLYTKKGI